MPIDYSKYPDNWKTEIVPRILKRANSCCEKCGLENHSMVFTISLYLRSINNGNYGYRKIWFRDLRDAERHQHMGSDVKPVRVILTIAHLDHDNENKDVSDDRLMAMCQYCHLQYDAKMKFDKAMGRG